MPLSLSSTLTRSAIQSGGETRANCDRVAAPPSSPLSPPPLIRGGGPSAVGRIAATGVGSRPSRPCRPFGEPGAAMGERREGEGFTIAHRASRSLHACVRRTAKRTRDRELSYYSERARSRPRATLSCCNIMVLLSRVAVASSHGA